MRGIELKTNRKFKSQSLSLLFEIDIDKYIWHIPEALIYDYGISIDGLSEKTYSGDDLRNIIQTIQKGKNLVGGINIRAFPIGSAITEPADYDEFLQSNCFLVYLVNDCYYIEIYCKDEAHLEAVYNKYKDHPDIESIEYKTDQNDGRYKLYVC